MLNGGEKPEAFPLKTGARQESSHLMLLLNIFLHDGDRQDNNKVELLEKSKLLFESISEHKEEREIGSPLS